MSNICNHKNFVSEVMVHRVSPEEGMEASHFTADIKIKCADCKIDFRFLCSRGGVMWNEPTVGIAGDELRVPIHPNDGTEPLPPKIKGFSCTVINYHSKN